MEITVPSSNCRCIKWNMHFSSKLGIGGTDRERETERDGERESGGEISEITG